MGAALAAGMTLVSFSAVQAQPAPADAPEAAPVARSFGVSPGLTLEASVLNISARAQGNGTEYLLRASPNLTMAHRGGRLQGTLIYSGALSTRRGIDDREDSEYLNSLSATYLLEVIDGIGFVDARASITQQTISAVGTPVGFLETSANRTEVRSVALSPYLRGPLSTFAEYELRAGATVTRGGRDTASDSDIYQGLFALRSPQRGAVFGWGLTGSRQRVKFLVSSAPTISDRINAELSFQPDIDWRLTVNGGVERTDVIGALRQEYENYGAGVQWTPSARTTMAVQAEERYFGRAYRATIAHRILRSTFRFASSRDINIGSGALAQGQAITLYELYFAQYASLVPDPVQRDQFVLALIAATGRDRNEVVSGGLFGNSGIALERRNDLIWTWAGPRLTMNASAYAVNTGRIDTGGVNPASRNDNTRQRGYAGGVGWRLTPLTNVNASGSRTMSKDTVTLVRSDLKSITFGLTSQLGVHTTGVLSTRYSVLNGATEAYRETALTGSLSLRF
ncbi:MAG: TIGR03016 family PEP-CTERM system-associated outer membrane protein [Burkholderiales bacterium]|nr:TIGR03016 family PEP-CTERM system-associated outer membrane protein [Burkholderiales bacterium]